MIYFATLLCSISLISPNFHVKSIIFSQFWPGAFFLQICWKKPCYSLKKSHDLAHLLYFSGKAGHRCQDEEETKKVAVTWLCNDIKIYHECEGRIEKSVLRIAVWHHEACWVMTNGDPDRRIFLSYPHTNIGFFFLLTTVFIHLPVYIYLFENKPPEVPEYTKMQFHMMTLLEFLGKIAW